MLGIHIVLGFKCLKAYYINKDTDLLSAPSEDISRTKKERKKETEEISNQAFVDSSPQVFKQKLGCYIAGLVLIPYAVLSRFCIDEELDQMTSNNFESKVWK